MFVSLVTANTLVYASPLFAALLGHFYIGGAEKVTRQGAFLLFLSFVGLILVIHPWVTDPEVPDNADKASSFWQLVGSLSELSVAVWLALYQILSRRNKDIGFPTVITTFTMYSTMIIAVVLSILAFCGWSEPFFVPLSGTLQSITLSTQSLTIIHMSPFLFST
jgi:drug/metabolite transporter (DMT)-like permease